MRLRLFLVFFFFFFFPHIQWRKVFQRMRLNLESPAFQSPNPCSEHPCASICIPSKDPNNSSFLMMASSHLLAHHLYPSHANEFKPPKLSKNGPCCFHPKTTFRGSPSSHRIKASGSTSGRKQVEVTQVIAVLQAFFINFFFFFSSNWCSFFLVACLDSRQYMIQMRG